MPRVEKPGHERPEGQEYDKGDKETHDCENSSKQWVECGFTIPFIDVSSENRSCSADQEKLCYLEWRICYTVDVFCATTLCLFSAPVAQVDRATDS